MNEEHEIEIVVRVSGAADRAQTVIEDVLDSLMERLGSHPALDDPSITMTFFEAGTTHRRPVEWVS